VNIFFYCSLKVRNCFPVFSCVLVGDADLITDLIGILAKDQCVLQAFNRLLKLHLIRKNGAF
jgi:hypothetical protein